MTAQALTFVQIDRDFAADLRGEKLNALQERLRGSLQRCRSAYAAGVAPVEARRLAALIAAYGAALDLAPALWRAQQRGE